MMAFGGFKIGMLWFIPPYSSRVGLVAPVALAFRIGGVNEVALTAYPFLLSILGVLVSYLAAKAMFGVRAGFIAACLMALLPIDVLSASVLLPDMPAALWMNAGVLLVYAGSRQDTISGKAALGALAGLSLFASWLCKETVLYLVPFVGLYLLWLVARDRRNVAMLLAGVAVVVVLIGLESWIYHRYAGDYLHRYHVIVGGGDERLPVWTLAGMAHYLVYRVSEVVHETLLNPYFAFTLAAAPVVCAYAAFRKSRRYLIPGLWFCWLLLLFSFGSKSLMAYRPLGLFMTRYLYPMLLPAVLLVSGFVSSLLSPREQNEPERRRHRRILYGVLVSVFVAGVSLVMVVYGIRSKWGPYGIGLPCRVEREIARILTPTDPLYTDGQTADALEFFWKYPATDSTHEFEGMSASQIPPAVYVLLNRIELRELAYHQKSELPEFADSVPATWRKLWDKDDATLYWVPPPPRPE